MKANLLSLGADYIVSRSKPYQVGGNDEDIKTPSAKEHEIRRQGVENIKLRRAKETCELSSAQMEVKTRRSSSTNHCNTSSTHIEFTTKKNHPQRMIPEEDMQDSIQHTTNGRKGDMRPINQTYLPNQKELSNQLTCYRNLTHQGITGRKNRFKNSSYEEVIQRSSQQTVHEPERDQRLLIEAFQLNQDETSCKPTCFGNLNHQRRTSNWINAKINCGLEVIQFLNQEILCLPYLEAHRFNHLPNRLWRPGEADNHSGDSSNLNQKVPRLKYPLKLSRYNGHQSHTRELYSFSYFRFCPNGFSEGGFNEATPLVCILGCVGGLSITLACTSIQRIRRIPPCSYLPYLEMFALKLQYLFPFILAHDLGIFYTSQNVPEKLTYPLKPSRYKEASLSPIMPDLRIIVQNLVMHSIPLISFLFLPFRILC